MPDSPADNPDAQPSPNERGDFSPDWRSMWAVLLVQTQNVFNDKIPQFMLIGLGGVLANTIATEGTLNFKGLYQFDLLSATLLSLAFILFAPFSGYLSDRFSKRTVLIWCMLIQLVVLAWMTICLMQHAFWIATLGFFLLAFQSTMLSPAKNGICKELVGPKKLAVVMGWMQMLVMVSIVLGMIIGPWWFKHINESSGDPWLAAYTVMGWLFAAAFLPLLLVLFVRKTPVQSQDPLTAGVFVSHFRHLSDLFRVRELRLAGLGVMYFWFAAASIALMLIGLGKELYPDDTTGQAALIASQYNGVVLVGIALGSMFVSSLSRQNIELGLVPAGAFGMAFWLFIAILADPPSTFPPQNTAEWIYCLAIAGMGFGAGLYLVPLNAYVQHRADSATRGRITSAINLLSNVASIMAAGFVLLLRPHLNTDAQYGILAIMTVAAGIYITKILPRDFLRFLVAPLIRSIYKVRALNVDNVPEKGGVLMISNHVSYVDAFIISVACPRHVRFVIIEHFLRVRAFAWFLRVFDCVPISPKHAKDAIRTTANAIKEGGVVCIFPEGQLTRTGMLNELKKGFELIARQAKCPVLPVYMDSLWGSIFSFERFRYFYKVPKRFPYPVTVNFGELIPHEKITNDYARIILQDLSVDAFADREDLRTTLGPAIIEGLKSKPGREVLVELGKSRRAFKRGACLAVALHLAKRWKRWPKDRKRVGVLLPAGMMNGVINLALVLARRVPVNLPVEFLTDAAARRDALQRVGIDTVITSKVLFQDEPMPQDYLDMKAELGGSADSLLGSLVARLKPGWLVSLEMGLGKVKETDEAVALLRNTESGYQLISLSHRNVLASVFQVDSSLVFLPDDKVFLDTGFDQIAPTLLGLWFPVLKKNCAVYRSLAARQVPAHALLAQEGCEIVLLSPDLLGELSSKDSSTPGTVRAFLNFSTTVPDEDAIAKLEESGSEYCHGLASERLGTIVSMNTKDPNSMIPSHLPQTGNRPGTVGRLMPGLGVRSMQGEDLGKLSEVGDLEVRGCSIARNSSGEMDWHPLGVRGSFDADGFLTLESQEKPASVPTEEEKTEEAQDPDS